VIEFVYERQKSTLQTCEHSYPKPNSFLLCCLAQLFTVFSSAAHSSVTLQNTFSALTGIFRLATFCGPVVLNATLTIGSLGRASDYSKFVSCTTK